MKALNPNDMQIHLKTQSIEFKIYNDYAWNLGKGGGREWFPKTGKIKFLNATKREI